MQGPLLSIALIVVLHLISSTNSKFWEGEGEVFFFNHLISGSPWRESISFTGFMIPISHQQDSPPPPYPSKEHGMINLILGFKEL